MSVRISRLCVLQRSTCNYIVTSLTLMDDVGTNGTVM